MTLFTKSIQAKPSKNDGIRICIMRRPNDDAVYDVLMPVLAPSHELLTDIHTKKIDKAEYNRRFHKEVVLGQRRFIKFLTNISLENDVTILCWEETPEKCHRKLVADACKKLNPDLDVVLR